MRIFGSLFGSKGKRSAGYPPELKRVLGKIAEIMADEQSQNEMIPEMLRAQIVGGLNVDELPHGVGEFGGSEENPIPVNGPFGELVYLSLLKKQDTNQRLLFHRLGSFDSLDIYETVTLTGDCWDIFFLSMYHPRKSRRAPTGYVISNPHSQPLLYGTNSRVADFPYGLQQAIRETTKNMIGIPLPPPGVREAEESIEFRRPQEHLERVKTAMAHVQGFRT